MPSVMTTCQNHDQKNIVSYTANEFTNTSETKTTAKSATFTFPSLLLPEDSNFTVMGSFTLLGNGGVFGVGVVETKFCNNRFGGG